MKKRILITGVLVALIMFVFILMGKKIVNSIWFKTQWDINFPFVESYYTVDGMWESYNIYLCSEKKKTRKERKKRKYYSEKQKKTSVIGIYT